MMMEQHGSLTYLYVPGNRPGRFDKAAASGAGAVVIDLEDAVPMWEKADARAAAARWLGARDRHGVPVWVRVNTGDDLVADLEAVVPTGPAGIWLPKCESAQDLIRLDAVLTTLADDADLAVSPLIETAVGLWNVREICRAPRVKFVQLGEVDLVADLGVRPGADGTELSWARSRVVAASVASQIAPPLGPASPEIRDLEAFTVDTEQIARFGFEGRACIHPAQLAAVESVFTPSSEETEAATRVLAQFAASRGGATVDDDGRLIDEAVARNARRVIARITPRRSDTSRRPD